MNDYKEYRCKMKKLQRKYAKIAFKIKDIISIIRVENNSLNVVNTIYSIITKFKYDTTTRRKCLDIV